jgi:hypothetical protein
VESVRCIATVSRRTKITAKEGFVFKPLSSSNALSLASLFDLVSATEKAAEGLAVKINSAQTDALAKTEEAIKSLPAIGSVDLCPYLVQYFDLVPSVDLISYSQQIASASRVAGDVAEAYYNYAHERIKHNNACGRRQHCTRLEVANLQSRETLGSFLKATMNVAAAMAAMADVVTEKEAGIKEVKATVARIMTNRRCTTGPFEDIAYGAGAGVDLSWAEREWDVDRMTLDRLAEYTRNGFSFAKK